jgi:hypothetical protein
MKHYISEVKEVFHFPRKKPTRKKPKIIKLRKFRICIILVLMIIILFVCSCKEQEPIIDNSDYGIFKKDTIELKSFIYKQTILFK